LVRLMPTQGKGIVSQHTAVNRQGNAKPSRIWLATPARSSL
jgi:hypothetical protein